MTKSEYLRSLRKDFVYLGETYLRELQRGKNANDLREMTSRLAEISREIEVLQTDIENDAGQLPALATE